MFGNALFHPSNTPTTPGRRHSHLDVSLAPKLSQRRNTSPVINVDGMSPGLGYMMGTGPSTPCFVTPTLGGFSGRRFSYDSPLQTMQMFTSGGLPTLNRKAAKRAWAKMSTKKWSRPMKIIMILILTTFAVTLFLVRKSKENTVLVQVRNVDEHSCNNHTGTCEASEAHYHENNPKEEFIGMVTQSEQFHEMQEESDLWVNRWTVQEGSNLNEETSETSNDLQVNVIEQEPIGLEDLPSKVMNYVESVKSFIGDTLKGSDSNDQEESELHEVVEHTIQDAPLEVSAVEAWEVTDAGNDHRHAVPNPEIMPMQDFAQAPQANKPDMQEPHVPQQPAGHRQALGQGVVSNVLQPPPVGPSQPLHQQAVAPLHQQADQQAVAPLHQQAVAPLHQQAVAPLHQQADQQAVAPLHQQAVVPLHQQAVVPLHQQAVPLHQQAPAPLHQQYHNQGMPPQQPAGHLRPPPQVIGVPAHHMPQQQYAHPMPNSGQVLPQQPQYHHNQGKQPQYHHNQGIIGHNPPRHQNNQGQKFPPGVNPNHYNPNYHWGL